MDTRAYLIRLQADATGINDFHLTIARARKLHGAIFGWAQPRRTASLAIKTRCGAVSRTFFECNGHKIHDCEFSTQVTVGTMVANRASTADHRRGIFAIWMKTVRSSQ